MLKRAATNELNHTNWDDEEEQEKPSDFKLASAEVMSKRVIKIGKRRLGAEAPDATASPFSKFSFGGASKSSSNAPPPASGLNSMSAPKPPTTNGVGQNAESKSDEPKDKSERPEQTTYLAKLKGLNEELISWIDSHFKKNPTSIFTPVFEDYNEYLKKIQAERDSKSSTPTPSASSSASPFGGFKFSADSASKTTPGSGFLGPANATPAPASAPETSKTAVPDKPQGGSIFGNTTSKAEQPVGSIFGSGATKTSDAPPFSFGGAKPFTFGNVANPLSSSSSLTTPAAPVQNEEDSEEPPKNEFKPVTEEDAVFSQRVKVFVKRDDDYADRGVGTLFIKPANNKYQVIVRADTSLGNLLLNIILVDGIPMKQMGKNNVMLVCVPLPGADSKPVPTLLKVKTKEDAEKLFEELNKYKK
uniref:Nuclear pore complex protein Nup50 n=1 Tax=Lygus hesperus TaxID=30085 RepID=A0A146LQ44_LYGHE